MIPLQSRRRSPQLARKDRGQVDHAAVQAEQRERRRKHLDVTYGEHFDVLVEVFDILTPLAERVCSEPNPLAYWAEVDDAAAAVAKLAADVAGLIATADAQRSTTHLKAGERDRAIRLIVDLAERPPKVEITDCEIASGAWVGRLTNLVGPYSGRLSDLLGRAAAPGTRRGLLSASETLVEALRVVDRAAISLTTHLDKAAFDRKVLRRVPKTGKPDPRAELAALGVALAEGERTSP